MNLSRRRFLFAAPAIVAASSLMPISVRALIDLPPRFYGDGIHDDAPYLDWMFREAERRGDWIIRVPPATFYIHTPVTVTSGLTIDLQNGTLMLGSPDIVGVYGAPGVRDVTLKNFAVKREEKSDVPMISIGPMKMG